MFSRYLILVFALSGCVAQPDMYRKETARKPPKEPTVTYCEGYGIHRVCKEVNRSEVQRVLDVLTGRP